MGDEIREINGNSVVGQTVETLQRTLVSGCYVPDSEMRPKNKYSEKKYKVLPSHLAHRAASFSDSVAVSRAPVEAGRQLGQCVARCACLLPQLMPVPNYTAW